MLSGIEIPSIRHVDKIVALTALSLFWNYYDFIFCQ